MKMLRPHFFWGPTLRLWPAVRAMPNVAAVPVQSPSPLTAQRNDRGNRTRQIIFDAAAALFADKGFKATGVRDIAAAAGVNHRPAASYSPFRYLRPPSQLPPSQLPPSQLPPSSSQQALEAFFK